MPPLEIGLTPWRYDAASPADALAEQAVRAESLGFRSFWLPESHFTGSGANPAPLLLLAAVAARTRAIRLASPIEPFTRLRENYAAHRNAMSQSHGELELAVPIMRTVFAHPDAATRERVSAGLDRQAAALASARQAAIRNAAPSSLDEWALVGEPAAVADQLARYREELDLTHLIARTALPAVDELDLLESLEHLAQLVEAAP